ncbi:MAG TPA: DUF3037 domain-containing protein [Rhodothermales bacterium]|nr:DUF3037 domain-containing protein [Rhodothermales bacterium]
MSIKHPYTFCVLRYVHDPIAEESLNVGILLFSAEQQLLSTMLELRYERLSSTFSGFDGERYKQVLRHFESAIDRERTEIFASQLFEVADRPSPSAGSIARRVWTDLGLSYRVSDSMAGLSSNLDETLSDLFDRLVSSQWDRKVSEHVSDDQVWSNVRTRIAPVVTRILRPKTFETPAISVDFQHAFQNERWHLVQPLSMDYKRTTQMQEKAARWLGNATALKENDEARDATLYFVLHPPESKKHQDAYIRAKNLLNKVPMKHEFFEEDEVESLSRELESHVQ